MENGRRNILGPCNAAFDSSIPASILLKRGYTGVVYGDD